jgi:chromosome condensin MukBEF MukE localization factor
MLKQNKSLLFKLVQERHPLETENQNVRSSGLKREKNNLQEKFNNTLKRIREVQILPSLTVSENNIKS